mgnify:CR=1 FL=1
MTQKKIEEQQRKILFARFQEGTLLPDMNAVYIKEKTAKPAETAKPSEPVEAAETTESAKPAESARYDYQFDFKYLLGNYYITYKNRDRYNKMWEKLAKSKTLKGENISATDPILLWYIYKKIDENEKNVRLFDCDSWNGSNDLMDEIYDRLWRNKMNKWGCSSSHDKFGGDTMNSFATTFHALFCDGDSFLAYKKEIKSIESEEREEKKKREEEKKREEKKKFYDALRKYAKLTGCLGNFVLVPKGFNGYRGLAGTIRDYWDLSLHELRCDQSGQGWLDQVDMPFNKYINLFFLWDYVSGKKNGGYRARPLFKSHEAILMREKMVLPRKADGEGASDDFSAFTENTNRCILRRGAFMSAMLHISAEDSDSYDKIVEYLATDASLGSMEDVIKQLRALRLNKDKNKNKKAKGFLKDLLKELKKIERQSETDIHEKNRKEKRP